ncbi:MAG: bifunctional 5,10-methylenetetrahydrofolate dehydrogenase/5,10-methenyltetrahydrofolate cyclohydrolase [Parcubacteria group bacterium]|nr:bifunctional 5,10-methylenetetrahydrofolate dehydrogenase/5,10-methenyltetrahydrofolate cyclohydrolase [Parcubacteria group bacterium]
MIIDGKQLSQEIIAELKKEREAIPKKIRLAVVLVGNDQASLSFIKQKEKIAQELNIDFRLYQYPETIKTKELRKKVSEICRVTYNRGIVVQLPLPKTINSQVVLNAILPLKDPDVLSEKNLGSFYVNRLTILPPVVAAIQFLLEKYQINVEGKTVLIIGRGQLVGKPAALWFINQRATVISANSKTQNLKDLIKMADLIVTSAGVPHLITAEMVKPSAIVFDAAVVSEAGKLIGDCDFESLKDKVALLTPVPGGLGPLVVAFLFKNLLTLVKQQK